MKSIHFPTARRPQRHRAQGFTLVEFSLVLLGAALVLAIAIWLFTTVLRSISINDNIEQLQKIAGTAKVNYGQQNRYGLVTTAVAVQGHIIPEKLRDGTAATATNNYGAAIAVAPATTGAGGANDALQLTWGNVPSKECNEIVSGVAASFRRIQVGGTDVMPLDGALSPVLLTTQCESGNTVAINFFIGRT